MGGDVSEGSMRYVFGDYLLDVERRELRCQGHQVPLRPKVFDLLVYLICQRARVVAKQELLTTLWPHLYVSPATLSACIKLARQAVGDRGTTQQRIQTLHGRGYRFVAPVVEQTQEPSGDPMPLGPEPHPQQRADIVDGGPEMAVEGEERALQRGVSTSTGEWKLVTVLCGTVVAPPPGTPLEVETYSCQVRALYTLAQEAVQRYGGTLQPFAGDQILAFFGVPLTQEAHAQRAVLAALALQQSIRQAESAASTQPGPPLEVRLGLHTGYVAVGLFAAMPEGADTVVGDTVTHACALQAQAPPGTIRCSGVTARLVHEVVQVTAVAPARMAGASPLDAVYTVLGRRTLGRLLHLQETCKWTPFIGRTHELTALHALVAPVEEGRGQVVGMMGEPGMGKTRLCAEFLRGQFTQSWGILDTRAVSYDQVIPYGPVIALLKDYFQVDEHEAAPVIRAQVTSRLLALDTALAPLEAPLLALLNVPVEDPQWQALNPSQRRWQTFQALTHVLRRASQAQPLLVVIENGHWLDTETQACLDSLVESLLPTARLLLLVTYRPDYRHGWRNKTYYTQLRLDPFPRPQARALLNALLGDAVGLQPLKQQIIAHTQGNPFFLEESVQMLIETGAVDGTRGAYRLGTPLPMLRVPTTVQAVLADRLDRLPPETKRLVQIAAVIGMEVPFAVLQALVELPEAALSQSLAHLQTAEFLYETGLFPMCAYTFKHALTHEVAYESLLQGQRRTLHRRLVDVLEALYPAPRAAQVERLAHHAVRGERWDKALAYCRQAGAKALARSAYREAIMHFAQALDALQHLLESRAMCEQAIDLRIDLCFALWRLGDWREALDRLREAEALAERVGDQRRLAHVSSEMADGLRILGDNQQALLAGQRARTLAIALGDTALQVDANTQLGVIYYHRGDYGRAIEVLRPTAMARACPSPHKRDDRPDEMVVWPWNWLLMSLSQVGAFAEGCAMRAEVLHLAEATAYPFCLAVATWGVGLLSLRQGDLSQAIAVFERGLALCHTHDLRDWLPTLAGSVGYAYALAGRLPEALALLEQAVGQYMAMRGGTPPPTSVVWLGEAYLHAGRLEEAYTQGQRALVSSRTQQQRGDEAYALWLLGESHTRQTSRAVEPAAAHYRQALSLAEELGMRPLVAHCHRGLGTLYATTGQHEQAHIELSRAIEMYHAMEMTFWLPRTEAARAWAEGQEREPKRPSWQKLLPSSSASSEGISR